jgi:hypothetical protein
VFALPHTAVVELQVGLDMTNAFLIDVYHFQIHYAISKNHTAVNCNGVMDAPAVVSTSSSSTKSSHEKHYMGVMKDPRRPGKWRASIQKQGRAVALVRNR